MLSPGINLLKWIQARVVQPVDSLAEILVKITWLTFRTHIISASSDARGGLACLGDTSAPYCLSPTPPWEDRCLCSQSATTYASSFSFLLKYGNNCYMTSTIVSSSHSQQVIWGPKWHFVLLYIFQQSVILLFSDCTI